MEQITLSASAKINLYLAITGIREDGYHLLKTVMQEISLADTIQVEKIPSGIAISCTKPGIPLGEKNLCHKAAKAYLDAAEIEGGVKITLIKAIPDGAGMGGGSSDAAAVLKAMKALYPSNTDLFSLAAKIGADVPFFLEGGTCLCEGIGEILTPISFSDKKTLFCVIAKPKEGLSTPKIFSLFDQMEEKKEENETSDLISIFAKGNLPALFKEMKNDLELPAVCLLPEIAECKEKLLLCGADAAMMTGSGSAVFGLFSSEKKARLAAETIRSSGIESHFCTLL
jgi:4-diphosphocytidyl-2-C-methyl-D-erythritol kinase